MKSAGWLVMSTLLAACGGGSSGRDGGDVGDGATRGPALDLLFVIDDSNTMIDEQAQLTTHFPAFLAELERAAGARPNLHIGVTSSNMGTGPYVVPACTDPDAGRLLAEPRADGCSPPSDRYITDDNHPGTLEESFACIAALGNAGCGFEQHLAAMKAALDGTHPENTGFLREEAFLAVVIIADEDDCSASNPELYNPDAAMAAIDGPLGPFTSFRCTEFGVECDGLPVRREAATYLNCKPHSTSPYLPHPRAFTDFLLALKPEGNLAVAVIAGQPEPFEVALTMAEGYPELRPSCSATTGDSVPGVRFANFVEELGARGRLAGICADDLEPTLTSIATFLATFVSP